MLKYAKSLLGAVFSRKRSYEEEENAAESPSDDGNQLKRARVQDQDAEEETYYHRVKLSNLPQENNATLKKWLEPHGFRQLKKSPKWDYGYLVVESEEKGREAAERLNGLKCKNRVIVAEYVKESMSGYNERFQKKRGKHGKEPEVPEEEDTRTPAERLADQVTPYHKLEYAVQLKKKHRAGVNQMMALKKELNRLKGLTDKGKAQIAWALEKPGGLPCPMLDILASPEVNNYRTKCEFTIGTNLEGEPTVGFLLGLYRHGVTAVLDPSECLNVSAPAKKIAKAMQDYVRASPYPVYNRVDKTGMWRTLMTKTQKTGEIMILVQMKTADMTESQVTEEKTKLIDYWNSFKDKPEEEAIVVTTLLFQAWNGDANGITDKAPIETLTGDGYVHEEILGCKFRISASAFFQINTKATELLYATCAEWCNVDPDKKTTLLDLCCGTGTIGITMAKYVDHVVGIEMVPQAIVDAKVNAELNGVDNVTYYAQKIENSIDVVSREENEDVVAVLDPPRNGVHASVIQAVRESKHINKVVYISCDAKQALPNFVSLCRPTSNKFRGLPFKPTRAVVIDLFPHTDHFELMIEFERLEQPSTSKDTAKKE